MTERLTQLLHDEAEHLAIPSPAAGATLRRGRALRRRRRAGGLAAAAAVLAVVGGGVALTGGQTEHSAEPTVTPAMQRYLAGGAYAVGGTVHFGDAGNPAVPFPGRIKSLLYTAEGLVVRTGTPANDPVEEHVAYALLSPEGDVRELDVDLGHRIPGADAGSSRLVYADGSARDWELVVVDLATARETERIPLDGQFTWADYEAPPVGLSEDTAYVALDGGTVAVDLDSGRSRPAAAIPARTVPVVASGRAAVKTTRGLDVIDLATGTTVLQVDTGEHDLGSLSPDGRFLKVAHQELLSRYDDREFVSQDRGFEVYDVSSGAHVTFDARPWDFGWTPDGHLLDVDRRGVTLCAPTTGDCTTTEHPVGTGRIRIPGTGFEY